MKYKDKATGTCPHCRLSVRFEAVNVVSGHGKWPSDAVLYETRSASSLLVASVGCPGCGGVILKAVATGYKGSQPQRAEEMLWPPSADRTVPKEVEVEAPSIAEDFKEAASVLPRSRKASAALARRCLQGVLTTKGGAKKRNLADQIDEVIGQLPSSLGQNVDAVRQVGNFAAHPMKSTSTGAIVEVEDDEADWLLDVLEELFDFYYVVPARAAAKRQALNKKLADAGKPQLKAP